MSIDDALLSKINTLGAPMDAVLNIDNFQDLIYYTRKHLDLKPDYHKELLDLFGECFELLIILKGKHYADFQGYWVRKMQAVTGCFKHSDKETMGAKEIIDILFSDIKKNFLRNQEEKFDNAMHKGLKSPHFPTT